jgi:hypothetical protein
MSRGAWENPNHLAPQHGRRANEAWDELMRRCTTIDEGIELLTELPRDFGAAGMLADRNGDCALVEIGRRRVEVSRRFSRDTGGTGINVNCWTRMQEEEGDPRAGLDVPTAPNRSRYERAKYRLGLVEGRIGLRSATFFVITPIRIALGEKTRLCGVMGSRSAITEACANRRSIRRNQPGGR